MRRATAGDPEETHKIAIAAAFHDLGIWTGRTFDYLRPSIGLACAHLARVGMPEWALEISGMIREHHKISRYRDTPQWLVEPFRRADWVDVSHGLLTYGLPRKLLLRCSRCGAMRAFTRGSCSFRSNGCEPTL